MLFLLLIFSSILCSFEKNEPKIFFVEVNKKGKNDNYAKVYLITNRKENKVSIMSTKTTNIKELESSTKWKVKKTFYVIDKTELDISLKNLPKKHNYCFVVNVDGIDYYSKAFYLDKYGNWLKSENLVIKKNDTNNVVKNYLNYTAILCLSILSLFIIF